MIRAQLDSKYPLDSEAVLSVAKDIKQKPGMSAKASSSGSQTSKPIPKGKRKPLKGKKSSCRKQYKKLKPKLKRLIEEGVMLKEKLRRKQDKLIEMSRDIHYILGRLLPYQKKILPTNTKLLENNIAASSPPVPLPDPRDVKPETPDPTWDFVPCSSNILVDTVKHRSLNFCLPPEVERQLASMMSDRPPLTLPDDIFSES